MTSLDRLGECEEVEGIVRLLAGEAGGYITAFHLVVDGGLRAMLGP